MQPRPYYDHSDPPRRNVILRTPPQRLTENWYFDGDTVSLAGKGP